MSILYVAIFAALLALPLQSQQGQQCKGNPHVVGACFKMHGRVRVVNGTGMVIWWVGTERILGVGDEGIIPDNLSKASFKYDNEWGSDTFGDFEVCPLTQSKPGVMQMVCVESASHLVVKKPVEAPSSAK